MLMSLKYQPSAVFTNLSLPEIISKSFPSYASSPAVGVQGVSGGSIGIGSGSASLNSGQVRYHKTENFSRHLNITEENNFDHTEFIAAIRTTVEEEIVRFGSWVQKSGETGLPGFRIVYEGDEHTGTVEVKSEFLDGQYLVFKVVSDETSTIQQVPVIERPVKLYQPISDYHVVAFKRNDDEARDFYEIGSRTAKESSERFRLKLLAGGKDFNAEDYRVIMYVWTRPPAEFRKRIKDIVGEPFELPSEYDAYDKVYFLSDLALQMFREADAKFTVLKTVPPEFVAAIPNGPSFRSYYVPRK